MVLSRSEPTGRRVYAKSLQISAQLDPVDEQYPLKISLSGLFCMVVCSGISFFVQFLWWCLG